MKYLESINKKPFKEMEKMQIFLSINGEKREEIWIRRDGDKCYLQNHAVMFYPFPTWGLELDFAENIDITKILKRSPQTIELTFHQNTMKMFSEFIREDGEFMIIKYQEFCKKEMAKKSSGLIDKSQLN